MSLAFPIALSYLRVYPIARGEIKTGEQSSVVSRQSSVAAR
ncbi:MAG: hypothetical protein AVDCRST_MAG18-2636 [uncultured Thermomicrobiales bacterium]|uniref:Uncharacterized protein n=1 Tax=uncultured Thermomicrobiales bacterium TaxID=1645740 RepID=A0A6J4VL37_9BACT|nr:MAG: hypothetical protein AVDCRST_MAG18-2636 [uncultured Thermomicrobiales bacterium]